MSQPAVVPSTPTCALPPVAPGRRVSVRSEQLHATRTSAAILATMGATWMSRGVDMRSDSGCGGGSTAAYWTWAFGIGTEPARTPWIFHACGARASVNSGSAPAGAGSGRTAKAFGRHRRAPACLGASGRGQHESLRLRAVALESRVALLRTWSPIGPRKPELSSRLARVQHLCWLLRSSAPRLLMVPGAVGAPIGLYARVGRRSAAAPPCARFVRNAAGPARRGRSAAAIRARLVGNPTIHRCVSHHERVTGRDRIASMVFSSTPRIPPPATARLPDPCEAFVPGLASPRPGWHAPAPAEGAELRGPRLPADTEPDPRSVRPPGQPGRPARQRDEHAWTPEHTLVLPRAWRKA